MPPHRKDNIDFMRKLRKRKINDFSNYCKQLCPHSLITGFPVIASTRNLLRKTIKILVFLACTCGFLYQTSGFLKLYRAYPTIIDIQIWKPTEVESPALSFCNTNRIRRKEFCLDAPEQCTWFLTEAEFCRAYPKYCITWEKPMLGTNPILTRGKGNRTREYVQKLGERLKDFMGGCMVKTQDIRHCNNPVDVPWVDKEGYPHNCFTVESLLGLPEAPEQKMPFNGQISLLLKPQPEQYFVYYNLVLVNILLHEAHTLGNPIMEGTAMQVGKTYNVIVNQRVTERLPPPYQTNCTDYLKLWKKNGGYGPVTGRACKEKCKMENMLETEGCVAQSVSYPGNYTICEDENTSPSDEIIKKCSEQCQEACREISYTLRQEVSFDKTETCGEDAHCKFKDIYLNFIFSHLEVEKFLHQPRYESVEMFSYIGGYMGMWLGISLVALFDFAETLVSLVTYKCRNMRKKKAVHSY